MPKKNSDKTEVLTGLTARPLILKKARFTVMNGREAGKALVVVPEAAVKELVARNLVGLDEVSFYLPNTAAGR